MIYLENVKALCAHVKKTLRKMKQSNIMICCILWFNWCCNIACSERKGCGELKACFFYTTTQLDPCWKSRWNIILNTQSATLYAWPFSFKRLQDLWELLTFCESREEFRGKSLCSRLCKWLLVFSFLWIMSFFALIFRKVLSHFIVSLVFTRPGVPLKVPYAEQICI